MTKRFQDTPAANVDVRKRTLKDYAGQRVCVHGFRHISGRTREGDLFSQVEITMRLASDPAHMITIATSAHKIMEQLAAQKLHDFPFTAMLAISDEGVLHFTDDPSEGVLEKAE